jgi:hypothetical protein
MSLGDFETFWEIGGERFTDLSEVESLVLAGHVAIEISAEKQHRDNELRELQENWHRESLDRYAKYAAEQQHKNSPCGKAEDAVRNAQLHPGGIVSGASNPALSELDQYAPDVTNVFK